MLKLLPAAGSETATCGLPNLGAAPLCIVQAANYSTDDSVFWAKSGGENTPTTQLKIFL